MSEPSLLCMAASCGAFDFFCFCMSSAGPMLKRELFTVVYYIYLHHFCFWHDDDSGTCQMGGRGGVGGGYFCATTSTTSVSAAAKRYFVLSIISYGWLCCYFQIDDVPRK